MIEYSDFEKVDIRVGTVVKASPLPKAKKPAYVLTIDFGDLGQKKSSAQITDLYTPEDLIGKQVFVVVNLAPRQVGAVMSECLVLGVYTGENMKGVVLAQPDRQVRNGLRLL
jgi:tRNA-binding protein